MNYGRYNIVSELGRGAMGMVYQAHDPQIDRMVALKVLREDRLTTEDYVQRFLKEATAIGRLSHPGIVTVYDVGQDHGTIYIAMEFLEGQPLDEVFKSGSLTMQDIVTIGVQVSEALQYAHKKGIVHRDIKPPNIIYTPEMNTKVTDFGIAHIDDPDGQQMTRAGEILGTPVYMAPEQVMGQTVDGRSDLYSLGVILYELSTGQRPFKGDNLAAVFRAITNDDPVAPHQLNPDVPPAFSSLILKAMAKKPEDRFATGQEFADLLTNCLNNNQPHDSFTETVIQQAPPQKRSGIGLLLTVLLLLCGAGVAAYFYLLPQIADKEQATGDVIQISKQKEKPPPIVPEEAPSVLAPVVIQKAEEPIVISTPPHVEPPSIADDILSQQAADSIEELFTDDRNIAPETAPPTDIFESESEVDTHADIPDPEPAPAAVVIKTEPEIQADKVPMVVSPPPAIEEVAPLLPPKKEPNIQKKMASLAMNSTPPGASLYIDGDYQGVTPIEIDITAMKHEVKLELQGHLGWQAQLNLSKGGKIPLSIPLLTE